MPIQQTPSPSNDSSDVKYEEHSRERERRRAVCKTIKAQKKKEDISEVDTSEGDGELKIGESCTVQIDDKNQDEDGQMGVKEEGIVEKINEELQEEVDWSPVLTRWMGKAQKEQHHSAEDDAQSEAFSGSTLVDEWQSEVAGMADFNEEQQEEVDWSQVLTSMGEAEKEQNHSTEDDTQSQWPSESILIGLLENETEPYEAASVAELYEAASVAAPGPYQAAREEYVFLIKDEKRLKILRDDIEKLLRPEIFEESFRNMLVVFATQLRAEARHSEEKDAARTVRINSIYIANCITEGIFKMVEFQRLPGRRNVLESYLLKYGQKAGVGNGVQIFERGEDDELDQFEENEPEGPINLLKMEAFIKSSRAWSKLFDNLESWIRDTEKAKGLWRKKQKIDSNNQNPPEQDAQSQQTSSDDTSSLTSSFKRTSFMHWSSYSIGSSTTRIENSPEVCSTVATLQVALLWAWAIKTSTQLYGKSNVVMQVVLEGFAIFLPMYATILLPREPIFKCYILCLLIPKAYMVYVNALGFGILASRTYIAIQLMRTEQFFVWLWGSLISEEETPHARVKLQCTCGDEFFEDFAESRERDAISLFEYLCYTGNRSQLQISPRDGISATRVFNDGLPGIAVELTSHDNSCEDNNKQRPSTTDASDLANRTDNESPVSSSADNGTAQNVTSGQPESATEVTQSLFTANSRDQRDEWFLLCHDHYKDAGKALNIRVPDFLDDLSLMRHLRRQYVASRGGFGRHFKWSKIRNFNFVRFQAHLDPLAAEELVFKDKEWSVPLNCCDSNWSPWPLKERPPVLVEKMLRHYWHYPHDSISFRFSNACKHLTRNIWYNCQSGYASVLNFLSHQPAPSSLWTAMRDASKRFYRSARNWIQKIWSNHKPNKETTLPQSNRDVNLTSQAPQGNSQQQQHSRTPPATPYTHFHQGTNPSAVTQPIPQQRLPYTISSVYPRRLHTELHPNPTCYGWGLYLDEGFAVPTQLIALLLILLFAVLISTLTVALVDFHRGDRYDAFSLPSWAVSVASLVGFILFWCCDRWR